jgi:hypothetical protein
MRMQIQMQEQEQEVAGWVCRRYRSIILSQSIDTYTYIYTLAMPAQVRSASDYGARIQTPLAELRP